MSIPFLVAMWRNGVSPASHNRPTNGSGGGDWFSAGLRGNAYDGSGNSVDSGVTPTVTNYWSSGDSSFKYDTFQGAGTLTGTLHVRAIGGVDYAGSVSGVDPSPPNFTYSVDGGTNWLTGGTFSNFVYSDKTVDLSAGVDITQLQVRFTTFASFGGSIKLGTDYNNTGLVEVSDIVLL
jgi:hypothetical protein